MLYYACALKSDCSLEIKKGVKLEKSQIINALNNEPVIAPGALTKSMYYTDKVPKVHESHVVELEQSRHDKYRGTKMILFKNMTEFEEFRNMSNVIISKHQ